MGKFLFKIFLFIIPVGILFVIIFFVKTERYFAYHYTKGDCDGRGLFFYNKIYKEKNSIDYIFIGSSKTMNGINDSMMQRIINTKITTPINIYNAGYCRYGRNLNFIFLKEFLKNHSIKKVFFEVLPDEATNSHPMFPFIATSDEIISSANGFNPSIFSDTYNHFLMNLKYERCKFNLDYCDSIPVQQCKFGYNNIPQIADSKSLAKFIEIKTIEWNHYNSTIDKTAPDYKFSNYYLNEIKTICEKNNIELNFIYLSSYGNIIKTPAWKEEYEKMGKLIIAPDSIFLRKMYWKDNSHFNSYGADAFSKFLITQISP